MIPSRWGAGVATFLLALVVVQAAPMCSSAGAADETWRCSAQGRFVVTVAVEHEHEEGAGGVVISLGYPGATVRLPGASSGAALHPRITNLTANREGLFQSGTRARGGHGYDDQVRVGLVDPKVPIRSGPFARVEFDCTPGTALADPSFTCTAEVVTASGAPVPNGRCVVTHAAVD